MNLLKIIAILAVIVAIIVAVIYVMGMWEPTKPIANAITDRGNQAVDYVKGNWPAVAAAGTGIAAVGGAALSKVNNANKKTTEVTAAANSQINGLLSEKDTLEKTFEAQKTQLETTTKELEETKTTAQNSLTTIGQQKDEITYLTRKCAELQEKVDHPPVNVVEVYK